MIHAAEEPAVTGEPLEASPQVEEAWPSDPWQSQADEAAFSSDISL